MNIKQNFKIGLPVIDTQGRRGRIVSIREDCIVYNTDNGIMEKALFEDLQIVKKTLKEFKSEIQERLNTTSKKKTVMEIDGNLSIDSNGAGSPTNIGKGNKVL